LAALAVFDILGAIVIWTVRQNRPATQSEESVWDPSPARH